MTKYAFNKIFSGITFLMISTTIFQMAAESKDYQLHVWRLSSPSQGRTLTVESGKSFQLSCTVHFSPNETGFEKIDVMWLDERQRQPGPLIYASLFSGDIKNSSRVNVTVNRAANRIVTNLTFIKADLARDPSHLAFTCSFGKLNKPYFNANLWLKIHVVYITRIDTSLKGRELSVDTGNNFTLTCRLTFDPTKVDKNQVNVQWRVVDHVLLYTSHWIHLSHRATATVTRDKTHITSTLHFLKANVERDSEHMVIACGFLQDKKLNLTKHMVIHIAYPYIWRISTSLGGRTLTVESGKSFQLSCTVTFSPDKAHFEKIDVMWLDERQGQPRHVLYASLLNGDVKNSSRVKVTVKREAYSIVTNLTFVKADLARDPSHMAFTCSFGKLNRPHVNAMRRMRVHVIYVTRIDTSLKGRDLSVDSGKNFTLTCRLTFDPTKVDKNQVNVQWRVVDHALLYTSHWIHLNHRATATVTRDKTHITSTLHFFNANMERDSEHMVIACDFSQNKKLKLTKHMRINIGYVPRIDTSLKGRELSVDSGKNFTLMCRLTFDPTKVVMKQVNIQWRVVDHGVLYTSHWIHLSHRSTATASADKTHITSTLHFFNANVERDSEHMVIACDFFQDKKLNLTKHMKINIAYRQKIETSLKGLPLTVQSGDNFTLTCTSFFDPRRINATNMLVDWKDVKKKAMLYATYLTTTTTTVYSVGEGEQRQMSRVKARSDKSVGQQAYLSSIPNANKVKATVTPGKYFVRSTLTFVNASMERDSHKMVIECNFFQEKFRLKEQMIINIAYRWSIRILKGQHSIVENGKCAELVCRLTFDPIQVNSHKIRVIWRNVHLNKILSASDTHRSVNRTTGYITSTLTLCNAATELEYSEQRIVQCMFSQDGVYSLKKKIKVKFIAVPMSRICGRRPLFPSPSLGRIIGGRSARPGEIPWQVYIRHESWKKYALCGGSVIHRRWVLTAAHCVGNVRPRYAKFWRVITANVNLTLDDQGKKKQKRHSHFQIHKIKRLIKHRGFANAHSNRHDIALLELDTPLRFDNFTQPVCLADGSDNFVGRICTVAGFGVTRAGNNERDSSRPTQMQMVNLPIISTKMCRNMTHIPLKGVYIFPNENICALSPGRGSCHGDSGSPLFCSQHGGRFVQAGLVSWGVACGKEDTPSVYIKVSEYMLWIRSITGVTFD